MYSYHFCYETWLKVVSMRVVESWLGCKVWCVGHHVFVMNCYHLAFFHGTFAS